MSNLEHIEFFNNLRKTFVVCPCCGEVYRITDSHLFQDKRPGKDWLANIESDLIGLEKQESIIKAKIEKLKEESRERGRIGADEYVARLDTTFAPLGLNPNDCKNLCHPVDFIVFNGMHSRVHSSQIKNLVFLDKNRPGDKLQDSIRSVIENERYEFKTMRITESGEIIEE